MKGRNMARVPGVFHIFHMGEDDALGPLSGFLSGSEA